MALCSQMTLRRPAAVEHIVRLTQYAAKGVKTKLALRYADGVGCYSRTGPRPGPRYFR
jgi:hypothetical protein